MSWDVINYSPEFLTNVSLGRVKGVSYVSKFGSCDDVDTGAAHDIWEGASLAGAELYTYSTTADIDTISSSSAADDQSILIQGLNYKWEEVTQYINLNGQTKVTLTTPLIRVYRMINMGSTDLAGIVYCYVNGDITDGAPDTTTTVRAMINDGNNQTLMCIYTVPAGKTAVFLKGYVALGRASTSIATMTWRARPFGGVFQIKSRIAIDSSAGSTWQYEYKVPLPAPEKTDILIRADVVTANNTSISGGFELLLFDNIHFGLEGI